MRILHPPVGVARMACVRRITYHKCGPIILQGGPGVKVDNNLQQNAIARLVGSCIVASNGPKDKEYHYRRIRLRTRFQIVLVSWGRERADLTHPPNPLPSPLTEREGGAAVRRQG